MNTKPHRALPVVLNKTNVVVININSCQTLKKHLDHERNAKNKSPNKYDAKK